MPSMRLIFAHAVLLAAAFGIANGLSINDLKAQVDAANTSASADAFTTNAVQNVVNNILPLVAGKHYVLIWNADLGITKWWLWNPDPKPFVEWVNGINYPAQSTYGNTHYKALIFIYGVFDKCDITSKGSSVWHFTYDGDAVCKNKSGNVVGCDSSDRCRVEWACQPTGANDCTPPPSGGPDGLGK